MLMVWLMLKKTAHVLELAHSGHTACTWGPMPDTYLVETHHDDTE